MLKNLFIAAALSVGVCASASPRLPRVAAQLNTNIARAPFVAPESVESPAKSRSTTFDFAFCGNPYGASSLKNLSAGNRVLQLTELPASLTKDFVDAELIAINIANPSNNSYKNTLTDSVKIVIYTDLSAEPVYVQNAKLGSEGFEYSKIKLKTPYVIKGDTPVYFGYEFSYKTAYSSLYYIITDGAETSAGQNYLGLAEAEGNMQISNTQQIGVKGNLCISADALTNAEIIGKANITELVVDLSAEAGADFYAEATVTNFSTEPLTSVGICYEIGGEITTVNCELDSPIEYLKTNYVGFEARTDLVGLNIPMTAKIVSVNGNPNSAETIETASTTLNVVGAGMGTQRMVVVEEGTGTWCQYCPMGYLLMEEAREKYEHYVGIAVHSGDVMAASSYSSFVEMYFSGFPEYVINRFISSGFYSQPGYNEMVFEYYYNLVSSWPAIASLDFEVALNEDLGTMDVNTSTTFGLSGTGDYRLAIVLKEDSVGPYRQTNAFYGQQGWGVFSTSSKPSLLYNDVAREIKNWNGIANSVPSEFEAGTAYEYKTSISTSSVKGDECDVVLMLINGADGSIEQAVSKHVQVHHDAAIDEISVAADASAEYFDINGRRLSAPGRGLTIVRTAAGTHKIMQ